LKACRPILIKANESRLELIVRTQFQGGRSLIALHGWESVESLRGTGNHLLVLDEVAMYRNFWSNWHEVLRPTLIDTKGDGLFLSTPKGFNHFYDLFNLEAKDSDYKSFHFTTYDNPYLAREEIEKTKLELTEDRFAQENLADFRKTEGLVYKEFNRERHLTNDEPENTVEYFAGVDFGFRHPAAVIHIKRDREDNYWVTDEWYKTRHTELQVAEYVASCKFNRVYPDPENQSAIQVLNDKGVSVVEVKKGKGSVESGISLIKELFKQNRIKIIQKNCPNLIAELEIYSYPEKKPDHAESDLPIKEFDDALDALRYAIKTNYEPMADNVEELRERALVRQRSLISQNR